MTRQPFLIYKYISIISIVTAIGVILYLSWTPDPNIGNLIKLPVWLSSWINNYGNLRTAVPFFLITLCFEFLLKKNSISSRIYFVWGSLIVVSIAEIGQLFLSKRHFDVMDIIFGLSGTGLGMTIGIIIKSFLRTSARYLG